MSIRVDSPITTGNITATALIDSTVMSVSRETDIASAKALPNKQVQLTFPKGPVELSPNEAIELADMIRRVARQADPDAGTEPCL